MPSVSRLFAQEWNPKSHCTECGIPQANDYMPQDKKDWGTKFHELVVDYFVDGAKDWPVEYRSCVHDVMTDRLSITGPVVEQPIGIEGGYAGCPDVLSRQFGTLRVFDWKTGLETKAHRRQLLAYAGIITYTGQWVDGTEFHPKRLDLVNVYFNRNDIRIPPVIRRRGADVKEAARMAKFLLAARDTWALRPSL